MGVAPSSGRRRKCADCGRIPLAMSETRDLGNATSIGRTAQHPPTALDELRTLLGERVGQRPFNDLASAMSRATSESFRLASAGNALAVAAGDPVEFLAVIPKTQWRRSDQHPRWEMLFTRAGPDVTSLFRRKKCRRHGLADARSASTTLSAPPVASPAPAA
jgi:hypothetical protein